MNTETNNELQAHLIGGNIGCIINRHPSATGTYIADYELNFSDKSFLNITDEHYELFITKIKIKLVEYIEKFDLVYKEFVLIRDLDLKYVVNMHTFIETLKSTKIDLIGFIANMLLYYFKHDKQIVEDFLLGYKKLIIEICNYLIKFNVHCNPRDYYSLDINEERSFFSKTIGLLEEHNDFFKIEDIGIDELRLLINNDLTFEEN